MTAARLLLCVNSRGTDDLQPLKVYRRLADAGVEAKGYVRVLGDSGAEGVYLQWHFLALPAEFERQVLARLGRDAR